MPRFATDPLIGVHQYEFQGEYGPEFEYAVFFRANGETDWINEPMRSAALANRSAERIATSLRAAGCRVQLDLWTGTREVSI